VRRMCEAIGHPVSRLKRVRIGPITDDHIRPGEFRDLSEEEVAALRREASGRPTSRPVSSPRTKSGPKRRVPRRNDRPRRG
jgi:hypothetical protein